MKIKEWRKKTGDFSKKVMKGIKHQYQTRKKLMIGIGVGALVVIALLIFLIASSGKSTKTVSYTSAKVTRGDITQTIDVVGNVTAVPSAVLNWQTTGIVGPVNLKVGDQVKEGDVLLSLVDNSVAPSVLSAQNDLLAAQLTLNTLRSGNMQLQTATQALAVAQKAYEKAKQNRDFWIVSNVSPEVIDVARAQYYKTKDDFWNAQQAYQALYQQQKADPKSSITDSAVSAAYDAMKAAELDYQKASRNLNYLIGNGYGNNNIVEIRFLEFDVAKATLAEAQATWRAYDDSSTYIQAAEANVQSLQNTINSAKIIAPFSGTVTDLMASAGQTVASGTEAVQMDDLNNLVITVSVPEVNVNHLAIGQEAEITFAAISGKTYKGVVEQVGKAGTTSSGVVEFDATIKVTDADEKVKTGFSATISIIVNQVQNILLVPNQAVMTDSASGKSYVVMSANGTMTRVMVEVGSKSDQYTEIKSGNLKEGDTILIMVSSASADTANNRALFGIMGGFGGGEPPRNPSTTTGSSSTTRRTG